MSVRYTRKDGKPSSYEFKCGALYERKVKNRCVKIHKEYSTFHILTFIPENNFFGQEEFLFESTDNLKEAWKMFNKQLKYIKSIKG